MVSEHYQMVFTQWYQVPAPERNLRKLLYVGRKEMELEAVQEADDRRRAEQLKRQQQALAREI